MDLAESGDGLHDRQVRHPWETARLEVVTSLINRHVELADQSVIIDVGCGDAFVVGRLALRFPSAQFYGIDPALTAPAIEVMEQRLSAPNVHLGRSLDALSPQPDRAASLVLLMDVIEHVEDDDGFVRELLTAGWVDDRTRVLVTVPAYQSLFSAHDVFLRHYRRYSRQTLHHALERSGLRVIESSYFFMSLLPLRLLQVIKERLVGRPDANATDAMSNIGRASAAILSRVLVADAGAGLGLSRVGITTPGMSICAICQKSA